MIALELFLDPASDRAVRATWAAMEQAGLASLATATHRNHHPHVTLAVVDDLPDPIGDRIAAQIPALPEIHLEAAGCFPGRRGVLFFAVRMTPALLELHQSIHRILDGAGVTQRDQLRPGRLFPHCTLAKRLPPDRLGDAMAIVRNRLPIVGPAGSLNAVVVGGDGAVTPIR